MPDAPGIANQQTIHQKAKEPFVQRLRFWHRNTEMFSTTRSEKGRNATGEGLEPTTYQNVR